jgi:hypothetical protein
VGIPYIANASENYLNTNTLVPYVTKVSVTCGFKTGIWIQKLRTLPCPKISEKEGYEYFATIAINGQMHFSTF